MDAGSPLTISVPEAAKRLGISRGAAYIAANKGEIPVIKIGRTCRVPLRALERMLDLLPAEEGKAA